MTDLLDKKKYKLGLALSGGGARGFAHPGAMKAIEDFGLKPEIISGTSAGALAGVLYADGYAPEEIIQLFVGKDFREFADIQVPVVAIFGTSGLRRFLKKHLHAKNFEDLKIPLKVIATNLDEGKSEVFDKGLIIDAVIASCSIPIVFNPVVINGTNYVDGGVFKNFPVSTIRSLCNKVIGVNVSPLVSKKYNKTILHIAERAYHYMSRTNTLLDRTLCDVLVEITDLAYFKTFDLVNSEKIFGIGYGYSQRALLEAIDRNIFTILCATDDGNQKIILP
ncbi:MAG: patatin-like phospholipase family protein [Dysgonamonadaceae bacterium]|jgi:NTE family protein|nr:patatin-like phospholipase family protein [Dysgonamonadaceae bacterium]